MRLTERSDTPQLRLPDERAHDRGKTLHFLFVCSQLVGIELIEMFINQAHIMLQYLFQWLEIEQSRQELVEISPLQ